MARSGGTPRVKGRGKQIKKQSVAELSSETEIWSSILDGRYTLTVHRVRPYRGELTIREGNRVVHQREVTLMYGATFGPDVDDVATWQKTALTVVDGLKEAPEIPRKKRSTGGPVA